MSLSPNVNAILGLSLQVNDVYSQNLPLNLSIPGITLPCTLYYYDRYFQVQTSPTTVNLPAATVWAVYVRNMGAANVTLSYTPAGGSSTSIQLLGIPASTSLGLNPSTSGGIFLYYQTSEGSGGITALSLQASGGTNPVEIFLGA